MEINQLRDDVVKVVKEKYPEERNLENRFMDLVRNVGEFGSSIQYYNRNYNKPHHDTLRHQIASVMVDLFMISDMIGTDIEKEVQEAIYYFKNKKHTSEYEQEKEDYFNGFQNK